MKSLKSDKRTRKDISEINDTISILKEALKKINGVHKNNTVAYTLKEAIHELQQYKKITIIYATCRHTKTHTESWHNSHDTWDVTKCDKCGKTLDI